MAEGGEIVWKERHGLVVYEMPKIEFEGFVKEHRAPHIVYQDRNMYYAIPVSYPSKKLEDVMWGRQVWTTSMGRLVRYLGIGDGRKHEFMITAERRVIGKIQDCGGRSFAGVYRAVQLAMQKRLDWSSAQARVFETHDYPYLCIALLTDGKIQIWIINNGDIGVIRGELISTVGGWFFAAKDGLYKVMHYRTEKVNSVINLRVLKMQEQENHQ